MAYKINELPSPSAYLEEIADFWEVQAIKANGRPVAKLSILKALSKGLDEISHEGLEAEEDALDRRLDDVLEHLSQRLSACAGLYPFATHLGHSLVLRQPPDMAGYIYLFLLFCTRFKMSGQNRTRAEVDGTLLFERLCAEVARNFFGSNAQSFVFGTAQNEPFVKKIESLISAIGEGGRWKNANQPHPLVKKDDGIDVVVWKGFADQAPGKLIGFCQCKTGTSWHDSIHKLKPSNFCDNWFTESPVFKPIPVVFLSDTMTRERNYITAQRGFLVLNRFRILEFALPILDPQTRLQIVAWVKDAMGSLPR